MLEKSGKVEVIAGPMYSGKTEELIRRLKRARLARQNVVVFKPNIDTRYSENEVASHDQNRIPCFAIREVSDIWDYIPAEAQVVGIDEAQFFSAEVLEVVERLAKRGVRVVVAGLDTDWKGKPFQPMPALMAVADEVVKLSAICVVCGASASRTQKVEEGSEMVKVGSFGVYEARCREHFHASVQPRTSDFEPMELGFEPAHQVSTQVTTQ